MAAYQRKITTQLLTVIEYDDEIGAIDRRLEQLQYKLKVAGGYLPTAPATKHNKKIKAKGGQFKNL